MVLTVSCGIIENFTQLDYDLEFFVDLTTMAHDDVAASGVTQTQLSAGELAR